MKSISILSILSVLLFMQTGLAQESSAPRSPRTASYDILVNYNPSKQQLEGDMRLYWQNPSNDTIRKLMFHTYMNAFKNRKSTLMREMGSSGMHRFLSGLSENGSIEVESMETKDGDNLTYRMKYVQPDDNNTDDQTVLQVDLRTPVLPGETLTLKIDFVTKMPKVMMRTGYSRDFLMAGQWYPKIGVYETHNPAKRNGSWNCHQFHAHTEFYADFGVYNVEIVTPKAYKVGATGTLVDKNETAGGKIRHVYKAEDVIDFAWAASKRFIELEENWQDIRINLLMPPEHKHQADRYFESVKTAMKHFHAVFGEYPYPEITLIDPPFHASGATGMEYPTLFTVGTIAGLPSSFRFPEMITIHEFGHQYLMGLLATNEAEEPWLDEGINTYMEARIMDEHYGANESMFSFYGYHAGDFEIKRHATYNSVRHKLAPVLTLPWEMPPGTYGTLSYNKPAIWMKTLENLLGQPTMDKILQRYYQKWRFKHPKTKDFIDVVNEVVRQEHPGRFGANMNWFFNQMLRSTKTCDYAVASVRSKKVGESFEMPTMDDVTNVITGQEARESGKKPVYNSTVTLHRLGEVQMPVEIKVYFDDGFEQVTRWDGKDRVHRLSFTRKGKIVTAEIDPGQKLLIDKNINNNSYTRKPDKSPIWKYMKQFLFVVQNIIQMFAILA